MVQLSKALFQGIKQREDDGSIPLLKSGVKSSGGARSCKCKLQKWSRWSCRSCQDGVAEVVKMELQKWSRWRSPSPTDPALETPTQCHAMLFHNFCYFCHIPMTSLSWNNYNKLVMRHVHALRHVHVRQLHLLNNNNKLVIRQAGRLETVKKLTPSTTSY